MRIERIVMTTLAATPLLGRAEEIANAAASAGATHREAHVAGAGPFWALFAILLAANLALVVVAFVYRDLKRFGRFAVSFVLTYVATLLVAPPLDLSKAQEMGGLLDAIRRPEFLLDAGRGLVIGVLVAWIIEFLSGLRESSVFRGIVTAADDLKRVESDLRANLAASAALHRVAVVSATLRRRMPSELVELVLRTFVSSSKIVLNDVNYETYLDTLITYNAKAARWRGIHMGDIRTLLGEHLDAPQKEAMDVYLRSLSAGRPVPLDARRIILVDENVPVRPEDADAMRDFMSRTQGTASFWITTNRAKSLLNLRQDARAFVQNDTAIYDDFVAIRFEPYSDGNIHGVGRIVFELKQEDAEPAWSPDILPYARLFETLERQLADSGARASALATFQTIDCRAAASTPALAA